MDVKITYCNSWSYKPQAFRVKDEIINAYPDANVEIIVGSRGNFIVEAQDNVIFSKKDMDRFPEVGETKELLDKLFAHA